VGAKIRGGVYTFSPMEWKRIDSPGDDIKKNIFPLPVREPSEVLFKLLSLLIDYTNRISGATEMLAGENPGQNTKVGTTDHMVEQGLKIYTAIFKRVWRSMKEEFKKLYILNAIHLPARKVAPLTGQMVLREWFLDDPNHIVPFADPNVTSDKQRVQQAITLSERARMVPGYNLELVERNLLSAMRVDSPEHLLPRPEDNRSRSRTRR
jgi:chaperonin GroES